MQAAATVEIIGAAARHESAHLHVSGEARYADDVPEPIGTLHAAFGTSAHAHARVRDRKTHV